MAPKPAMQTSAARKVDERSVLAMSTDAKSDAADGVYQRIAVMIVDLAAHAADIDVDDVGGRVEIQVPDVLQQHRAWHHLALVAHQIFQHLEFARQQFDLFAGAVGGAGHEIEFEVADAQHGFLHHGGAAPRQRFDARQQFGEHERLDQIIVAAAAQPAHAVIDFAERAHDQRRRVDAGFAQLADDHKTVDARQHAIDGHHRVAARQAEPQAVVAVVGEIDLITARAEKVDELTSGFRIVFDDEDATPRSSQCLRSGRIAKSLAQAGDLQTDMYVRKCRISNLSRAARLSIANARTPLPSGATEARTASQARPRVDAIAVPASAARLPGKSRALANGRESMRRKSIALAVALALGAATATSGAVARGGPGGGGGGGHGGFAGGGHAFAGHAFVSRGVGGHVFAGHAFAGHAFAGPGLGGRTFAGTRVAHFDHGRFHHFRFHRRFFFAAVGPDFYDWPYDDEGPCRVWNG